MTASSTVLLTGGSRGIGLAIAREVLARGHAVHLIARDLDRLIGAARQLSGSGLVTFTCLDLADPAAIDGFCRQWQRPLYGIVNNAGWCRVGRIDEDGPDAWGEILAVNLTAVHHLTRGLVRVLQRPGRIVNISSQLGQEGRAGYGAYCASKFGLIGLTRCWAKELGGEGITVNAVCPGWVATEQAIDDMTRLAAAAGVPTDEYRRQVCAPLELKRFTEPAEVAALVGFLLSPAASGITGRDWLLSTIWNQT